MLTTLANVFGVVLLLVGILGFIPGITTDQMLLGIFHVNGLHNIVHLVSGAAGLWAAKSGMKAAKMYFQVFGVIYALVTVLGFFYGNDAILGIVSNNMADTVLHLVIAVVALYLGFGKKDEMGAPTTMAA
ncbi:MAG: DUF4383 domain-containing protein [Candidatus Andersenbacteria bacterium]|nr:DUF4383 domain-containing protein [Candidatus Andersenbacteria bacterium]